MKKRSACAAAAVVAAMTVSCTSGAGSDVAGAVDHTMQNIGKADSAGQTGSGPIGFECTTDNTDIDKVTSEFSFELSGLGTESVDFYVPDGEEPQIETVPEESHFTTLLDNWVIAEESGGLTLRGDADGIEYMTVVLFADSGYKKGYARLEDGGGYGIGDHYSTITCAVKSASRIR